MNALKQRLAAGDFITASWAELGSPDIAEILVRHGWDVIVIDGEHGIGELEDWVAQARAIEAAGGTVVLRVPDSSETVLKRVLDRGFTSLIIPMVNSAAQAQDIVDCCRYPLRGRRGYAAPIMRASHFGLRPDYAREESHEELLIFAQCEHPDAIKALPEIAAVDGIDGIFLGPNDLSATLGHLENMQHPETLAALQEIESAGKKAKTIMATITGTDRGWAALRDLGYQFAVGPNDISFLIEAARTAAQDRDQDLGLKVNKGRAQKGY